MEVGLFIPCYVDQLAPTIGMATASVLERVGCSVVYEPNQTCCGQPFLNLGEKDQARRLAQAHLRRFSRFEAVVSPSASCVAMVRRHFGEIDVGRDGHEASARERTFELGEFLVRKLLRVEIGARFPHRVVLLQSCHGLRELGLGTPSERAGHGSLLDTTQALLKAVDGLDLRIPERVDECCGFGGAFSVQYPELSGRMGRACLEALAATEAEYVTSTDVTCLLHLDGIRARRGGGPRPIHLAEILARTPAT